MTVQLTPFSLNGKRVYVSGHTGMVGSAVVRALRKRGIEALTASSSDVDLRSATATFDLIQRLKPDVVIVAAAKVGGIAANNSFPRDFLYDNLAISMNVIEASHKAGVEKLLFLGSSCIYPKFADQPISESSLLAGPLEPTNEWYAIAKIAGLKLALSYRRQFGVDYISAMPTNLYGPGDNYHPEHSHVVGGLIRRIHEAKLNGSPNVVIWGTGKPRREFLFVDDLAEACLHLIEKYSGDEHVNVGTGSDVSIVELANLICQTVGYSGSLVFDTSRPDGTPRKLLDVAKIHRLGWRASTGLREGLAIAYEDFKQGGGRNK